ncbi:MAG: class II glutamine amidotransferase [Alphaproteobacteria bacterium]|nr:class II glutamine amidotransferase [Alphaproteobacteria bacterium]MCB9974688.1 class II glutamine amidotransferase [Rhodospirillales bacterium]
MCRWIAYIGEPIFMDRLVTKPAHSLVEQSLHATHMYRDDGSLWTTNGDGFGIGWYGEKLEPGLFKDAMPAWNDQNLHELCSQTRARLFFAHIRASTQGGVQRNNSHPFKCGNWLFQHNGDVENFSVIKRTLQNEVSDEFYPMIRGNTDSETCFYLALTYGLRERPKVALERMVGRVMRAQIEAGLELDLSFSAAVSNGESLYTMRYHAPGSNSRTQFYTKNMDDVVDKDAFDGSNGWPDDGIVVVSEPLNRMGEHWTPVFDSSFLIIRDGKITVESFSPQD